MSARNFLYINIKSGKVTIRIIISGSRLFERSVVKSSNAKKSRPRIITPATIAINFSNLIGKQINLIRPQKKSKPGKV